MLLSLTGTCVIAGAILAGVNEVTKEPIAQTKAATLEAAIKAVTPTFDNKPTEESYMVATPEGDSLRIYPAKNGGEMVGAAVESFTKKGFGGEIKVIVGFDMDGKIINYSVLSHSETPGLGAKMQEWFSTEKGNQSVIGRKIDGKGLTVSKDGGDVDAITAATISSRAFLDAINKAYTAFSGTDAQSMATSNSSDSIDLDDSTEATESTEEGGNNNE